MSWPSTRREDQDLREPRAIARTLFKGFAPDIEDDQ